MSAPGPTLETERLILRPTSAEDFPHFCEMMADADVARFIGGVQSPSVVWRAMCSVAGSWALFGYSFFTVLEKESGDFVGRLGPWKPEGWPGTEVGWGLKRSAWGKGYAVEGARAAIDWAFDTLGWESVIHCIEAENTPSIRTAERLGSYHQGEAQAPEPFSHVRWQIYGQTREEWRARRVNMFHGK